jgi:hypothetical protein
VFTEPSAVAPDAKVYFVIIVGMQEIGFASKVMSHVRFGFAAGCEAVALPRRREVRPLIYPSVLERITV